MTPYLADLNAAVIAAGLEPLPQRPVFDDRFLRWGRNDHAWLIGHEARTAEGAPYALVAFGSWRSGEVHQWCSLGSRLPGDIRARVAEDWQRLEQEARARQAERQQQAAQVAARRFAAADPNGYSPYLERKVGDGRALHDLRVEADGTLLVPVLDWQPDGSLAGQSLQAIAPDGQKTFQPGGKVRGGFCVIGWPLVNGNPFAVCEGVATGISIQQATGLPVVCAFSAGNLAPVVAGLRIRYPDNALLVCADNDRWTAGNPGLSSARALIDPYRVTVRYPEFGDDPETLARKPTDFNDLANRLDLGGLAMVRHQILGEPVFEAGAAATPEGEAVVDPEPTPASPQEGPSTVGVIRNSLVSDGARKRPAQSHVARNLADALRERLAFDERQQVWREYQTGEWRMVPTSTVCCAVQRAMDDAFIDGYSDSYVNGVLHLLSHYLTVAAWNPQQTGALPLTNGVLDLAARTLRPHRPGDHWTWQLPFAYNPLALAGPVTDWLLEACGGFADRVEVLRAWIQAVVLGRTDVQRYLELIGPGGSGKSTFLGLLEAIIGADNLQVTELKHLEGRFETAGLLGKRLLVVTDQQQYQGEVSVLKSIVGQDRVRIEHKYKAGISSERIGALVVLAANHAIRASDYSSGMERRRIFMPFDHFVAPDTRRDLHQEFAPYLSGVLNWALALPAEQVTALLRETTRYAPSLAQAHLDHQEKINPLSAWAREELTLDPNGFAPWGMAQRNRSRDGDCEFLHADQFLYASYSEYCATHGMQRPSSVKFQSGLLDLLQAQWHLPAELVRCNTGEHRNRRGLRGVRLARVGDPPLGPISAPVPSVAPASPVAPVLAQPLAQVSTGFTKECASAPVAPAQNTLNIPGSSVVAASPVTASQPSRIEQYSIVNCTGALAQLAQKEEKQEVGCASMVFGTGATGATAAAPGATGAPPRCATCLHLTGDRCALRDDLIDYPDVGSCLKWKAPAPVSVPVPVSVPTAASPGALRELPPIEMLAPGWQGLAPAMAELMAVPVAYLLAGQLTDPEWEQMVEANLRLYADYPQRRADLATLIQAIDRAANLFIGDSS